MHLCIVLCDPAFRIPGCHRLSLSAKPEILFAICRREAATSKVAASPAGKGQLTAVADFRIPVTNLAHANGPKRKTGPAASTLSRTATLPEYPPCSPAAASRQWPFVMLYELFRHPPLRWVPLICNPPVTSSRLSI